MKRISGLSRGSAKALIAAAFAWFLAASDGAHAQESPPPAAAAPSAAQAEAATQSRRDRRRAPKPQPAAASDAAATTTAAPAAIVEPERICKSFKPLGSHMAKRVCGTPEQWAAFEKKTTDAAEDDMRNVRTTTGIISTNSPPTGPP